MARSGINGLIVALVTSLVFMLLGILVVGGAASEFIWGISAAISLVYTLPASFLGLYILHKVFPFGALAATGVGFAGGLLSGGAAYYVLSYWLFLEGSLVVFLWAGAFGGILALLLESRSVNKPVQPSAVAPAD